MNNQYFILPAGLSSKEVLVYYYISTQTNYTEEEYKGKGQYEFNISLRTAESDLGMTKKVISNILKTLEKSGYIKLLVKGKPPKTPSKYKLLFNEILMQKRETMKDTIVETIQSKEIREFTGNEETMKETIKGTPSIIYINNNISAKSTSKKDDGKEEAFNEVWNLYPRKRGKAKAKSKIYKLLDKIQKEELIRAVERYKKENQNTEMQFIKHGDTFFNAAYEDYLDCNYEEPLKGTSSYRPKATNFDY